MFSTKEPLEAKHRVLIIGCGHACPHAEKLHAGEEVYTVDASDQINPDLIGDVLSSNVLDYLQRNVFDLICIESVPALICLENEVERANLINRLMSMLSPNGTFIILASGNLQADYSLFNTIIKHTDAFTLHNAYHNKCGKYPNSTLVAHCGGELISSNIEYINKALELKYHSSGNIRSVETKVITRAELQQREALLSHLANVSSQSIFKLKTNHDVNDIQFQNTSTNSESKGCAIQ